MNCERDTREVMSVDAFSQLPFIRSTQATKEKNSSAIRLFGIEFPRYEAQQQEGSSASSSSKETNKDNDNVGDRGNTKSSNNDGGAVGGGQESNDRKFECHYCCRNFPTSQALGGHQNAHKRERQQAKRAHLQSAVPAHYRHQDGIPRDGLYGFLNYQNSVPTRFGFGGHYPSCNCAVAIPSVAAYPTPGFYGDTPGPMSHPVNGSPVSGPWRSADACHRGWGNVGPEHCPNSAAVPLFGDGCRIMGGGSSPSSSSSSYSPMLPSQNRLVRESKPTGVQHISLDLHL